MLRPPIRVVRLLASFALLAAAAGCDSGSSAAGARSGGRRAAAPVDVTLVPAETAAFERAVVVTGTLAAEDEVTLSFKVAGRIAETLFDLGSPVKAGELVARLDPTDFDLRIAQAASAVEAARVRLGLPAAGDDDAIALLETSVVRQAKATLEESRAERDRAQSLFDQKLISQSELDTSMAAYLVAESRYQDGLEEGGIRQAILAQRRSDLALARQQRQDAELRSPLDGAVRMRHVSAGEYVTVGAPVFTVVRTRPLRLRLAIPERESHGVVAGLAVRLRVEADVREYTGVIARVSPSISVPDRTLTVEAEIPNEEGALRPGSFARATIRVGDDDRAVAVPESALVSFAGIEKVFLEKDGKAVERRVLTGRRSGGRIEIVRGLEPGTPVVEKPGNLVGGDPVVIAAAAARRD